MGKCVKRWMEKTCDTLIGFHMMEKKRKIGFFTWGKKCVIHMGKQRVMEKMCDTLIGFHVILLMYFTWEKNMCDSDERKNLHGQIALSHAP
jgi:hypothetical protein